MLTVEDLEEGDVVYALVDFHAEHPCPAPHQVASPCKSAILPICRNDGSFPEAGDDVLLAAAGTRGVIVRKGHLEEEPERTVFLVRFEDGNRDLGPPLGCWAEELRAEAEAED